MPLKRHAKTGPAPARNPAILLTDPDPYLAFLLRLDLPEANVVEEHGRPDADALLARGANVIIADLEDERTAELLSKGRDVRVIGVVDRGVASRTTPPEELETLLVRPFLPAELYRAVRRALGMPTSSATPAAGTMDRIRSWFAPARVAAVAIAAIFELGSFDHSPWRSFLLAGAFAYVALRLGPWRHNLRAAWVDAAVAAGLLAATGGITSSYGLFGLLAAAEVGLLVGAGPGSVAGTLVAAGGLPSIALAVAQGSGDPFRVALWVVGFPVAALAGALASRIWRMERSGGVEVLEQANQLLSMLHRIARSVPGSLDLRNVAAATLEELRETVRAPAAVLLVSEAGMLVTAGSYGMGAEASGAVLRDDPRIAALLSGTARLAGPDELPAELGAEGHASWIVVPLRRSGIAVGLLAVASTEADNPDATRFVVEQLANETAVAVENAQLFARVGELSAQEERRRLARELHDGVAQGLAHVRFELGLLARGEWESEENVRSEVGRLSRVVGRALDEVRSTIVGLRPAVEGAGLSEALDAYLRDLRALGGPELTFRTLGTVDLPTTVSEEVFRIGQEAVSNALRHAHAQRVTVTLEGHDTLVVLTVTDDGIGIRSSGTTGGIGLRAMNERAQRIDGRLRVTEQPSGGTRVELLAPLPPTEIDAEGGRT